LRGDTAFTQTEYLDGWDDDRVKFIFGIPVVKKVEQKADQVPESQWKRLTRPPKYAVETAPRQRPDNVKDRVVIQRESDAVHLDYEQITDFEYTPVKCRKSYRIVVLKKHLLWTKGQHQLLQSMSFQCDIDAMPEGTVVFPHEPLVQITGPILQCQILETPLLNMVNFQTLIATKAARVCAAARGDSVLEFGLRRTQGIVGAIAASRAAGVRVVRSVDM